MYAAIQETAKWLNEKIQNSPTIGIILGTGLGNLVEQIDIEVAIPYEDIPHFPVSTVEGHSGKLIFGRLGGKNVVAMAGRFHYYEGHSMKQVTFPIRVMHALGVDTLFVSNAAGGTNPGFGLGDMMIITDQINFLPENPLTGENIEPGPRFVDMSECYDSGLRNLAATIASEKKMRIRHGVYLATQGPTYETPSEYRMFAHWGADAVGMSTVPEVIVARHCGIRCFGVSIITNLSIHGRIIKATHTDVQKAALSAEPRMSELFKEMIARC